MPSVSLLNDQFSHDFQYVLALTRYEFDHCRSNACAVKEQRRACIEQAHTFAFEGVGWRRADPAAVRGNETLFISRPIHKSPRCGIARVRGLDEDLLQTCVRRE